MWQSFYLNMIKSSKTMSSKLSGLALKLSNRHDLAGGIKGSVRSKNIK